MKMLDLYRKDGSDFRITDGRGLNGPQAIDLEGNPILDFGNGEIVILINGKPTTINVTFSQPPKGGGFSY